MLVVVHTVCEDVREGVADWEQPEAEEADGVESGEADLFELDVH